MEQAIFDPNNGVFAFVNNTISPLYIVNSVDALIAHDDDETVSIIEGLRQAIEAYWLHRMKMSVLHGFNIPDVGLSFVHVHDEDRIGEVLPEPCSHYYMETYDDSGNTLISGRDIKRVLNKMAEIYLRYNQEGYDDSQVSAADSNYGQ